MAYTPTYEEADTTPIIFDVGLKILAGVGTLATVFGIVVAINLLRGKKMNMFK